MKCEQTKSGWTVFKDALTLYLEAEGCKPIKGERYFQKDERKFFILPMCELEKLRDLRKETPDYDSPVIFLISGESERPDVYNKKMPKNHRKELFGNPEFGNISKAILPAEIITTTSKDSNVYRSFQNVVKVLDKAFPENVIKLLKNREDIAIDYGKYRQEFYKTFVEYYYIDDFNLRNIDPRDVGIYFKAILDKMVQSEFIVRYVTDKEGKKKETELYKKLSKLNGHDVDSLITCADIIHCYLNDINYNDFTHRVDHELFRAPIAFPLHELVDAEKEIKTKLRNNNKNKIKLLLIDNKINKVINEEAEQNTLGGLFHNFAVNNKVKNNSLGDFFKLQMLGNPGWTTMSELSNIGNFKDEESETFKFDEFGKELKTYKLSNSENQSLKKFEYLSNVYDRIKKAHFVLLDFFLNEENTYLAFDFIRDIADIKRKQGDVSTTWYFITSAVYDSVVKYSQSGLLAEYYESAVVSAGDDPTNKKRQIIFLYKLLTFINARLNSFKGYKDSIMKCSMFNKACDHNNAYCRKPEKCLFPVQSLCRKYTAEYNEITEIFPGTKEKEFKETVELLESITTQFLWLPEADWPMIQRQIEHLNIRFEKETSDNPDETEIKFCCKYILKELQKRSEIY